ncbi:MAG: hypothetical protein ACE5FA_10320, partial [Dehalococcoidia bacterium]
GRTLNRSSKPHPAAKTLNCFRSSNNTDLSRLARELLGSSAGHARDSYDAAEAGLNVYLQRVGLDLSDPHAAIE